MLTCVVMPRLPRNALVEWHAVATQQLPKSECKLPSLLFSETYCIIDYSFFIFNLGISGFENEFYLRIIRNVSNMSFATTKFKKATVGK